MRLYDVRLLPLLPFLMCINKATDINCLFINIIFIFSYVCVWMCCQMTRVQCKVSPGTLPASARPAQAVTSLAASHSTQLPDFSRHKQKYFLSDSIFTLLSVSSLFPDHSTPQHPVHPKMKAKHWCIAMDVHYSNQIFRMRTNPGGAK